MRKILHGDNLRQPPARRSFPGIPLPEKICILFIQRTNLKTILTRNMSMKFFTIL